jgi:hypothetical protein
VVELVLAMTVVAAVATVAAVAAVGTRRLWSIKFTGLTVLALVMGTKPHEQSEQIS